MNWNLLSLAILAINTNYVIASSKNIVCYYGTWATYRLGLGKFDIETVNPHLCTHLVYTFVGIQQDGTVISLDPYLDLSDNYGRDNLRKFNALKLVNPELKTLLAVGGWNEGSAKYSTMVANPTYRANFIRSALQFILEFGFDGFDLDWEYPNQRDSAHGQADVENFSQLLRELRATFDEHQLILTAAVAATEDSASLSYDISALCENLDIVNLMTYDMSGSWDGVTGYNAGLYSGDGSKLTVNDAVEYWLGQGCPPQKLAMGVPFYGRSFSLIDPNVNGLKAPTSGPGLAGPFTATKGTVGYNEETYIYLLGPRGAVWPNPSCIQGDTCAQQWDVHRLITLQLPKFCDMMQSQQWEVRRDEVAKVPYAVQGVNWVTYDDTLSITAKVEYALSKNLGGIMMWSIETDDFNGVCGETFPLLKAINNALQRDVEINTTSRPVEETTAATEEPATEETKETATEDTLEPRTEAAATETTVEPEHTTSDAGSVTTEGPAATDAPNNRICKAEGITADPENCAKFYICINDGMGGLQPVQFTCSTNLLFDRDELLCNYPELVDCDV